LYGRNFASLRIRWTVLREGKPLRDAAFRVLSLGFLRNAFTTFFSSEGERTVLNG